MTSPARYHSVFISHSQQDAGWVENLLIPALTAVGLKCRHESLFSLGKPRLLEFEEAVRQCDVILLICSPAYFADESLHIVDLLAARHDEETKSWPVIPIIRHAVELPLRLRILEPLDATDQASWPDALTRLCNELRVDTPHEPKRPRCPYPGMKPFERDSEFPFYGRQEEVGEIIERLRLHPFLAVIGASGCGKSSLVHAGLIPKLNRTRLFGEGDWLTLSFRPGGSDREQSPLSRLENHLGGQVGDPESAKASVDSLLQVAREASQPIAQQLLLVVDQFEEVYTLQNEHDEKYRLNKDDADRFQRALMTLADVPDCYVVLTVRSDYFGDLIESPIWDKGVKDHRFELTTLGDDGMRQAIVQPALDQDVCIDQVLVERLLSEAGGEPGILPFLQETLVLLWGKLRWRYLWALDYESIVEGRRAEFQSGLEVAMAERADATISSLPDEEHRLVARRIFLRLVQFGEARIHTRRQQTVAQLSSAHPDEGIFGATLTHLTEKRLVTIGDARASRRISNDSGNQNERIIEGDQRSVDIAHDKLLTAWPQLRKWIDNARHHEETRRAIESLAMRWAVHGKREDLLLSRHELTEAESLELQKNGELLEEFLTASRRRRSSWLSLMLSRIRGLFKRNEFNPLEHQIELLRQCKNLSSVGRAHLSIASHTSEFTPLVLRSFLRISEDVSVAVDREDKMEKKLVLEAILRDLDNLILQTARNRDPIYTQFTSVARQWREAVAEQIIVLAAQKSREIDSPYIVGPPLSENNEMFVGRRGLGRKIERLVLDHRCPPLLLYGQRRVGKTSLLRNIERLVPKSGIVPLFIDLQGPASRASNYGGFVYNIARSMHVSAKSRDLVIPTLSREACNLDPFTAFDEWLDQIEKALDGGTALLAFDEFEALDDAISAGKYREEDVLGTFRHVMQHRPRFKILLAGSHTIDEMWRWAGYLINVQTLHIGYLEERDARLLIEQPVPEFPLQYERKSVERLIELTRCHPFLVQLVCREIIARRNERGTGSRICESEVEDAIPDVLESGSMFFADIERNQVNVESLKLLRELASRGENGQLTRGQLAQSCPHDVDSVLRTLLSRRVVEQIGDAFRFEVEIIRRWFAG